jgi:hypothetical protein
MAEPEPDEHRKNIYLPEQMCYGDMNRMGTTHG